MIPAKSQLDRIVGEINYHEERSREAAKLAILHKLTIGRLLTEAKALLPHGAFGEWAQGEFGWSRQHLHRHMQLHEERTRVLHLAGLDDLSMRAALASLGPAKPRERWMVVGYLDAAPGEAEASALAAGVKDWKVRKA